MLDEFKVKLDYGKAIIICDESMDINSYRAEIRPKFAVLKNNLNKMYCLDHYEFTRPYGSDLVKSVEDKGYEVIDISETIRQKIEQIVSKELNKYIEENIDNTKFITEFTKHEYTNYTKESYEFLEEASKFREKY